MDEKSNETQLDRKGELSATEANQVRHGEQSSGRNDSYSISVYEIVLTSLVVLNIMLTIWVFRILHLADSGIGSLKLLARGLVLDGDVYIHDELYVASIMPRKSSSLKIFAADNITLNIRKSDDGQIINRFQLNATSLNAFVNQFAIRSRDGKIKFLVDEENVVVETNNFWINNTGGIDFKSSIQTPLVHSYLSDGLKLESTTRNVKIKATRDVTIDSYAGGISVTSLRDLTLKSTAGNITLESSNIAFHGLKVAATPAAGIGAVKHRSDVYQLCACRGNGKLFLVSPQISCFYDRKICTN
ncbi:Delta-sarcoglycan-like protein, partial [Dinothrombium tinctorium]